MRLQLLRGRNFCELEFHFWKFTDGPVARREDQAIRQQLVTG